jgi:hypothetical protein
MSVKLKIAEPDGIYFITITCFKWLPLFNISDSYESVYKWFQYLKLNNHFITGYVIIRQRLNYIHSNPCTGKWNLADMPESYVHSSAGYYGNGLQGIFRWIILWMLWRLI